MKEKFREWQATGPLSVSYKDGAGKKQSWGTYQDTLLVQIQGIVKAYQAQNITLTSRQLFYQLVAAGIIPNADAIYKRICKFLTDARYGGHIDWDAIEDRGRVASKHSEWDSVKDLIRSAVASYRLPRWQNQDYYTELFCEKEAMGSILRPIAEKYHITFGTNKGYSSASMMYELAKRVKEKIEDGKKVVIFYLGDMDPSGLDMDRDIKARVEEFLEKGEEFTDPMGDDEVENFQLIRIALTSQQVQQYNPPPNPAKVSDPRAKWYVKKYGTTSWELDALKPEVLIALTENAIQQYMDIEKYNAWIRLEDKQKRALAEFGEGLAEDEHEAV